MLELVRDIESGRKEMPMFQATKIHAPQMDLAATAGKWRKSPSECPPIIMALPEGTDGQLLSCPRPLSSPVVASLAAQRGSSSSSASCFSAVAGGGVAAAVTTTTTESLFAAGIAAAVQELFSAAEAPNRDQQSSPQRRCIRQLFFFNGTRRLSTPPRSGLSKREP